uniref:U15-Liphistoxin-Lth1a_1 n=1 Tax=Liphistius thaleban TaxID=1905330 RepID=A0A4Q8K5E0_9ARAC
MGPLLFAAVSLATVLLLTPTPSSGRKPHDKEHDLKHKSLTLTHAERSHHADKTKDLNDHDSDIYNYIDNHEEQVECHKAALHKCGQSFLKAFKLLNFLSEDLAFQTKCALRTAFFNCLKKIREKMCRRHYKHTYKYENDFRRKLTDALWSTRVCVLGIKGYPSN